MTVAYWRIVAPDDPFTFGRKFLRLKDAEALLKQMNRQGYEVVGFTASGKRYEESGK